MVIFVEIFVVSEGHGLLDTLETLATSQLTIKVHYKPSDQVLAGVAV